MIDYYKRLEGVYYDLKDLDKASLTHNDRIREIKNLGFENSSYVFLQE
jgi:hypothetical protein